MFHRNSLLGISRAASVLSLAVGIVSIGACNRATTDAKGTGTNQGGSGAGNGGPQGGEAVGGAPAQGGHGSGAGQVTGDGGTPGTGGGTGAPECDGQAATVHDVASGDVGPGIKVKLTGVVAMSQKFLVSKSSTTGSCLWGVFVSAPGLTETAEYSGTLVLSYGFEATKNADGKFFCPKLGQEVAGGSIPDNTAPGDVLDVVGETSQFVLNQCKDEVNGSSVGQRQVAKSCKVEKTGTAAVPTPHTLSGGDVALLGSPTDSAFHDKWGGVNVRITAASPVLQDGTDGQVVVGQYGVIKLEGSNLQLGTKVYYRQGSDNFCHQSPAFDTDVTWTAIDGFNYLNFCTWDLEPNDKCADYTPQSTDCNGALVCPVDVMP